MKIRLIDVMDIRTEQHHSEVICDEKRAKYFEQNEDSLILDFDEEEVLAKGKSIKESFEVKPIEKPIEKEIKI